MGGSNIGVSENIYVVRTDNYGLLGWSKIYSIGRVDVATDIEEVVADDGRHDGFIITGYTNPITAFAPAYEGGSILSRGTQTCTNTPLTNPRYSSRTIPPDSISPPPGVSPNMNGSAITPLHALSFPICDPGLALRLPRHS